MAQSPPMLRIAIAFERIAAANERSAAAAEGYNKRIDDMMRGFPELFASMQQMLEREKANAARRDAEDAAERNLQAHEETQAANKKKSTETAT